MLPMRMLHEIGVSKEILTCHDFNYQASPAPRARAFLKTFARDPAVCRLCLQRLLTHTSFPIMNFAHLAHASIKAAEWRSPIDRPTRWSWAKILVGRQQDDDKKRAHRPRRDNRVDEKLTD